MTNFGKYGISGQTEDHGFSLEPEWVWRVKSATFDEERRRDAFMGRVDILMESEGVTRRTGWPTDKEVEAEEIWITFGGTNIPTHPDKPIVEIDKVGSTKANVMFPLRSKREKFMTLLGELPSAMVEEIHGMVREVNPHWDPSFESED